MASVVLALLRNWQVAVAVLLAVTGFVLIALNLHELFAGPRRGVGGGGSGGMAGRDPGR